MGFPRTVHPLSADPYKTDWPTAEVIKQVLFNKPVNPKKTDQEVDVKFDNLFAPKIANLINYSIIISHEKKEQGIRRPLLIEREDRSKDILPSHSSNEEQKDWVDIESVFEEEEAVQRPYHWRRHVNILRLELGHKRPNGTKAYDLQ